MLFEVSGERKKNEGVGRSLIEKLMENSGEHKKDEWGGWEDVDRIMTAAVRWKQPTKDSESETESYNEDSESETETYNENSENETESYNENVKVKQKATMRIVKVKHTGTEVSLWTGELGVIRYRTVLVITVEPCFTRLTRSRSLLILANIYNNDLVVLRITEKEIK